MEKSLYQDELDQANHEDAMRRLCQEHPDWDNFIRQSYMQLLRPLITEATIRTYLPIFISREIKEMISRQKH